MRVLIFFGYVMLFLIFAYGVLGGAYADKKVNFKVGRFIACAATIAFTAALVGDALATFHVPGCADVGDDLAFAGCVFGVPLLGIFLILYRYHSYLENKIG